MTAGLPGDDVVRGRTLKLPEKILGSRIRHECGRDRGTGLHVMHEILRVDSTQTGRQNCTKLARRRTPRKSSCPNPAVARTIYSTTSTPATSAVRACCRATAPRDLAVDRVRVLRDRHHGTRLRLVDNVGRHNLQHDTVAGQATEYFRGHPLAKRNELMPRRLIAPTSSTKP